MAGFDLFSDPLLATMARLQNRIEIRFPERRLLRVAHRLHGVALKIAVRTRSMQSSSGWRRVGRRRVVPATILVAATLLALCAASDQLSGVGVASFALASVLLAILAVRQKRSRAMDAIHELRILAHLVDIRQLDKDPVCRFARDRKRTKRPPTNEPDEPNEPGELDALELNHYLGYCSEMLTLIGMIAAHYGRHLSDSVTRRAFDQLKGLTQDLNRAVWPKVIVLDRAFVPG